jgi:polysaccharide deacetylase family protein (PEP-CTERM system associated)
MPVTARSAYNTRRLLELFAELDVRATMFVLGKFAKAFPEIVREIDSAGHEIASHGWGHVEIFAQTRQEFAADVSRSKDLLEQLTGRPVRGYRAPDFSIVGRTLWALEILAEIGFGYDSSIFPVRHPRYGIPDWPANPREVRLGNGGRIVEMPIATVTVLGRKLPVGGGGYHRLMPGYLTRRLARIAMRSSPFVFYCHPYELDFDEFKELSFRLPVWIKLHQGLGRRFFEQRLRAFLAEFGGQRMIDAVHAQSWSVATLPLASASENDGPR